MKNIRVGIVGAKFAADIHCDSYSRNDQAEVAAVADIADASELMKKWNIPDYHKDYAEMFKRGDIDLISVCVPNFLHHDVAIAAADAGTTGSLGPSQNPALAGSQPRYDRQTAVYDITARIVYHEVVSENQITWNGRDNEDNLVADGVYLLRVVNEETKSLIAKAKILVIKR